MQYCCVVRGRYLDGDSVIGCDFHVIPDGFFYHVATEQTFQVCYEGEEITTAVPNAGVLWGLDAPVTGAQHAQIPSTDILHDWAIIGGANHDGAYEFNIGEEDDLRLVYCAGRGVITGAGLCRMNGCDDLTNNYVTVGPDEPEEDDLCYHTCFVYTEPWW